MSEEPKPPKIGTDLFGEPLPLPNVLHEVAKKAVKKAEAKQKKAAQPLTRARSKLLDAVVEIGLDRPTEQDAEAHELAQREKLARLFGRRAQPARERPGDRPQPVPSSYRLEEAHGPTVGLWQADRGREEMPEAIQIPAQDWNQAAQKPKTRAEEYQEKMQQVRGQRRRRKPRRGPGED